MEKINNCDLQVSQNFYFSEISNFKQSKKFYHSNFEQVSYFRNINIPLRNFVGTKFLRFVIFFDTLQRIARWESTPGGHGINARRKSKGCSKECLVSSSNSKLALESVAKPEEHVMRYPFGLLHRRISEREEYSHICVCICVYVCVYI